jgi:hypothetical protein
MSPVQVIEKLLVINPSAARIILAGIAIFAAAAIVLSFNVDTNTALIIGGYVLVFGVVVTLLSNIGSDALLMKILGRGIVVLLLALMTAFSYAAVVNDPSPIKSTPCLVRFWAACRAVEDELAQRTEAEIRVKDLPENSVATSVDRSKFSVFIQFAGYRREDVVAAAKALQDAGWKIPDASRGGERVGSAASLAEVRYRTDAQKKAATLLAAEISKTGIKPGVKAVQVPGVTANVLEVWIGL